MRRNAWMSMVVTLLVGCSGSGISTTARTDTGASGGSSSASASGGSNSASGGSASASASGGSASATATASGGGTSGGSADGGGSTGGGSSDPSAGTGGSGGGDTGSANCSIVGTWLSAGDNIAPLLVQLTHATMITAKFDAQTFDVITIDNQGQQVEQTGVYTSMASSNGSIMSIELDQSMPQNVTAKGIYQVDCSSDPWVLTYEIIQTDPDVGAGSPPTADQGFGATTYGSDLTQIYVRQ